MENQNQQEGRSEPHVQIFGQEVSSAHREEKQGSRVGEPEDARAPEYERRWKKHWGHRSSGMCCDGSYHHHHHGSSLAGLLFVFGGLLLILNNVGIVPWEFWHAITGLWPLIFVYAGLQIVAGHDGLSHFIMFLAAVALLSWATLYGLVAVHSPLVDGISPGLRSSVESFQSLQ